MSRNASVCSLVSVPLVCSGVSSDDKALPTEPPPPPIVNRRGLPVNVIIANAALECPGHDATGVVKGRDESLATQVQKAEPQGEHLAVTLVIHLMGREKERKKKTASIH